MKLLTLQEAGELMQLHPDTVRRLCQRGELPGAMKLGGSWRVHPAAFEPQWVVGSVPPESAEAVSLRTNNRGGWR